MDGGQELVAVAEVVLAELAGDIVVAGTEGTKLKVATGEYNRMIDARIAEIKQTCGVE